MLDSLRNSAKSPIMKGLLILLAVGFAGWGVNDVVTATASRTPAIKVGDIEVAPERVAEDYQRELRRLQEMFGGGITDEQARQMGVLDRTIQQIVSRALLDQAAQDLGMVADMDSLRREIATNPAFHNAQGKFDADAFRTALSRAGYSEGGFLSIARLDMVRSQIASAVTGGVAAPSTLIAPLHRYHGERRVAETVLFETERMAAPKAPDDGTLAEFHKANSARFMAPEYRAVSVLTIRPGDVAGHVTVTDQMIAEAYEQRLDEFVEGERRNVRQILFDDEAAARAAVQAARGGARFDEVAKAAAREVGSLGWVERQGLPADFAEPVFALPADGISEPLQSPLGWHVFNVTGLAEGRTRPLADVRDQIRQDLAGEKALDLVFTLGTQVQDALAGGATLEEAAQRLKIGFAKAEIDQRGRTRQGQPADTLPQSDTFLAAAFATERGRDSELTELDAGGYFLLRVDEVTPPALKPYESIKDEVAKAWVAEQRANAARQAAEAAAAKLKEGAALAQLATEAKSKVTVTQPLGREGANESLPRDLIERLFTMTPGEAATAPMPTGTLLVVLKEVVPAGPVDGEGAKVLSRQAGQTIAADILDQYLAALTTEHGVTVNRKVIEGRL
ncbi:MAG: peptidyl-prolyl cis-trans isomerase [Alphaproteobacteria bacterium]|nr:peptidyl-prolyl cis-trans isomerase [Alphaproteobacteria bacterium]